MIFSKFIIFDNGDKKISFLHRILYNLKNLKIINYLLN